MRELEAHSNVCPLYTVRVLHCALGVEFHLFCSVIVTEKHNLDLWKIQIRIPV